MSKITIVALQNKEQTFNEGQTPYAMFSATVPNETAGQAPHNIVVGLSHNLLERSGITPEQIIVLPVNGCTVDTNPFLNNLTGEEQDPEDQINKIIDGQAKVVLLGGISATFNKSADFIESQTEYSIKAEAYQRNIAKKEQKLAQRAAQARLLANRSLVGAPALETVAAGEQANLGGSGNRRNRPNNSGATPNAGGAAGEAGPAN